MRETIRAYLEADATLLSLLTGGFYAERSIKRGSPAAAFDANGEIEPCVNVKMDTELPFGPYDHTSQAFFSLYFYQFLGYDVIDPAKERAFVLLDRQCIPGINGYEIRHVGDVPDQEDDALLCSLHISRYMAVRNRAS